jgi:hypothetical protein
MNRKDIVVVVALFEKATADLDAIIANELNQYKGSNRLNAQDMLDLTRAADEAIQVMRDVKRFASALTLPDTPSAFPVKPTLNDMAGPAGL